MERNHKMSCPKLLLKRLKKKRRKTKIMLLTMFYITEQSFNKNVLGHKKWVVFLKVRTCINHFFQFY